MANTTREQLYVKFGPLLIEAMAVLLMKEINELRTKVGLSPRTKQQAMDALENELEQLEKYDWMTERDGAIQQTKN